MGSQAEEPPNYYEDKVKQMNPDGKQKWGDPRPQAPQTGLNLMEIPINVAAFGITSQQDATDTGSGDPIHHEKSKNPFAKLKEKMSSNSGGKKDMRVVVMTRTEYENYWIKGNDGEYKSTVTEPPEGREEWLRKQLELTDQYRKNEKEYKKKISSKGDTATESFATMLAWAGPSVG